MINPCRARKVIILILLASLIGVPGCASKRKPLSETLMAEMSSIGVVLRPTHPDVELQIPGKGRLANAGRGAVGGSVIGQIGIICYAGFIVCVPALATVGAIGGAIYGAVAGEPASEWEQAESTFKGVLSDLNVQQQVRNQLVEFARSQRLYKVIRVEGQELSPKDEKASYRALASKGIDTVLELTELAVYLRPREIAINPPRILTMATRTRMIRTLDGAVLDERVITVNDMRAAQSMTAWTDQNAQVFREEVTLAAQNLAQQAVKELFSDTHVF